MAKDDDLPQVDIPYYGRLSHPISPIAPIKYASGAAGVSAAGEALGGIGRVVEGASKLADRIADRGLTKIAEDTNQPLVNERVGQLEATRDQLYGSRTQATTAPTATTNIPGGVQQPGTGATSTQGGDDQPLDTNAQSGVKKISDMVELKRSGKISNTAYLGNLDSINSDIRARLPMGMRRTYDQKVAEVTGVPHTANAYIASMTADINDAQARAAGAQDKIATRILNNPEVPGSMNNYQRFMNGQDPGGIKALSAIANYHAHQAEINNRLLDLKLETAEGRDPTQKAQAVINSEANQIITDEVQAIAHTMGDDHAFDSAESTRKFMSGLSTEQGTMLKAAIADSRAGSQKKIVDALTKPRDGLPQGLLGVRGMDTNAALAGVKPLYAFHDALDTALTDPDSSPIFAMKRAVEQQTNHAVMDLLKDPKLGPQFKILMGVSKALGNQTAAFFSVTDFPNLTHDLSTYRKSQEAAMVAEPGQHSAYDDAKQVTERMRSLGYKDTDIKPVIDSFSKRSPELLTNPNTPLPVKENFVDYYYGPKNQGFLTASGTTDAVKRYDELFSPRVTKAVKQQLSDTAWQTYKNRAQSYFSSEIATPLVKKLAGMVDQPQMRITFNDDPEHGIPFDYDSASHKGLVSNPHRDVANPYRETITELNTAYLRMADIAKAEGRDPKVYAASVFKELGTNDPVAEMIYNAISHTEPPKDTELGSSTLPIPSIRNKNLTTRPRINP